MHRLPPSRGGLLISPMTKLSNAPINVAAASLLLPQLRFSGTRLKLKKIFILYIV